MEPALAGVGALATAVAVAASLRARTAQVAVLAMGAALVLSPLALSPLPAVLPLAFWLVTALLATYLLVLAEREGPALLPPLPLGGWAEAAFVLVGLALGWAAAPIAGPGRGPATALAAGVAVAFAAVPLAAFSRDTLRTAIGTVLFLDACGLVAASLTGTPGQLEVVALGLAIVGAAAASREVLLQDVQGRGAVPDLQGRGAAPAAPEPRAAAAPAPRPSAAPEPRSVVAPGGTRARRGRG